MKTKFNEFNESRIISQQEAADLYLPQIEQSGKEYKKFTQITARPAVAGEVIETITSDGKETTNTAKSGDYVVTNIGGEEYILSGDTLKKRYESLGNNRYQAIGECKGIVYTGKPTQFMATWGEAMVLKPGDMIVTGDGKEVYRIAIKEFKETYRLKSVSET